MRVGGIEPPAFSLSVKCSTTELHAPYFAWFGNQASSVAKALEGQVAIHSDVSPEGLPKGEACVLASVGGSYTRPTIARNAIRSILSKFTALVNWQIKLSWYHILHMAKNSFEDASAFEGAEAVTNFMAREQEALQDLPNRMARVYLEVSRAAHRSIEA